MKNKTQMIFKKIFTASRKRLEPKRMENKGYFFADDVSSSTVS